MRSSCLLLILLFGSLTSSPQDNASETQLFNQSDLKLISSEYSFTEGASPDKQGNVFFTDQPNDKIWKFSLDGKLSVFLEKSGRANGTYFDKAGNLIACADEKGELWSIDKNGRVTIIMSKLQGKQANGPNDLWIDSKGGIYFTDPYYQRDYWTRTAPDLESENVYYLSKDRKTCRVVAGNLVRPNGIVGTPDGKYLYVADAQDGKTYQYTIAKNGDLTDRKLLINKGSDGMTLDSKGNIYLTGNGVSIYSPQGNFIAQIKVPEGTTNLCFSGKNRDILFITARKSIYTIPMKVKGVE